MALAGMFQRNPIVAIIGATGIFFSACYSIYLYNRISYGAYSPHLNPLKDLNRREFILLITLLVPTIILGIFPNVVLETLHSSVTSLLYNIPLYPLSSVEDDSILLLGSILSLKSLSNDKTDKCNLVKDADFLEWFRGFTDAESNFFYL